MKGLYAGARAGTIKNFTGVSDPFMVPADSFLEVGLMPLQETMDLVFKKLGL